MATNGDRNLAIDTRQSQRSFCRCSESPLSLDICFCLENAGAVVDRRGATHFKKDQVWVCSHRRCNYSVLQPEQPANHAAHPSHPMTRLA